MKTIFTLPLVLAIFASAAQGNESGQLPSDMEGVYEQDLPVVLSAMRLKQPRSEVPGSITVITAEQIDAWGARTIPELLRYVPGMVIGHSHYENNTTVSYHISNPNLMRRMQVLVDGRSVYKNSIAAVIWDDIPVALEDIARIEVVRGPNSASYGANAFMSTINIITKDPIETLGARVRYRSGNKGENDAFISQSGLIGEGSYRISASLMQHDGFDSKFAVNNGGWTDSKQHGFVNALYLQDFGDNAQFEIQGALKKGRSEIKSDGSSDLHMDVATLHSKAIFNFSERHQSQLQIYWMQEKRTHEGRLSAPKVLLDTNLHDFYLSNPRFVSLAMDLTETHANITSSDFQQKLFNLDTRSDKAHAMRFESILTDAISNNGLALVNGSSDSNIQEQRVDIEWQDTIIWNNSFRTVTGLNFRHDWVESEHYFDGYNQNSMYRAFANAEWRMTPSLIWNLGAMYEVEEKNEDALSPRLALNWLLSDQQSLRFVVSQSVRSPDLLEQEANHGIVIRDIRDESGALVPEFADKKVRYYEHRIASGNLQHERITSYEIGYFGNFPRYGLELDIKLYQDRLTNLISAPVNSGTLDIQSDVEIDVNGIDLQLQWQLNSSNSLWFAWAYNDNKIDPGSYDDYAIRDSNVVIVEGERRASARNTYVASWQHKGNQWAGSLSYFWYDQYNNGVTDYRRLEMNLRKEFAFGQYTAWIGFWWQHIFGDSYVVRTRSDGSTWTEKLDTPYVSREYHRYDTRNIYFVQAGLNF